MRIKLVRQSVNGEVWSHRRLMKKEPVSDNWLVAGNGRITSANVMVKKEVITAGVV